MDSMKLRLFLMGCILTVVGVILLVLNGFSAPLVGILVIGIILAVVGIVWKPREKADRLDSFQNVSESLPPLSLSLWPFHRFCNDSKC